MDLNCESDLRLPPLKSRISLTPYFIIADGRNILLGKIFVDTIGQVVDLYGVDDNTGKETFVVDPCRESKTKVIDIKKYADKWTMELAIPIGVFY